MSLTFFRIGTFHDELIRYTKEYLAKANTAVNEFDRVLHASVQMNHKDYDRIKSIPAELLMDLMRERVRPEEVAKVAQFEENGKSKAILLQAMGFCSRVWTHGAGGGKVPILINDMWIKRNKPYYNVYPDYAHMFLKTRLDIPCKAVVFPYEVFDVLFSMEKPLQSKMCKLFGFRFFKLNEELKTKMFANDPETLLTCKSMVGIFPYYLANNEPARLINSGCMAFEFDDTSEKTIEQCFEEAKQRVSERLDQGHISYSPAKFDIAKLKAELPGIKNEDALKAKMKKGDLWADSNFEELYLESQRCLRIAVSIAFLSGGGDAEVLGPDFLKKDFGAYLEALKKPEGEEQEKAVKAIQKKTDKERESASFAVGKYEHLLGRRYITHSDSDREPAEGEEGKSGRELHYCHIRNPHFRMVRYGTGRAQVRSKLIKQIIVRKDLPPKPAEVEIGFTTPKALK
jgi:hypothetical protein